MNRRNFVASAAAATGLAGASQAAAPKNAIFELRYYKLSNNSRQTDRTHAFLGKGLLPAAQRAGLGPLGFFGSVIAPDAPFVLALLSYPSLAAFGESLDKLAADKDYQSALADYSAGEPPFVRIESSLLRAFDGMPALDPAAADPSRAPRTFELRVYESRSPVAGKTKVRMFNEGEIAIFQRLGFSPLFFGETIVGPKAPNLAYMVAFENLAAREKLWGEFGRDPQWQKMRALPAYPDSEIVSNITNALLRPTPYSPIR